ncbi:MAG: TauD/TfdA dioxygenase family protein, partial [Boseongicola sp.]
MKTYSHFRIKPITGAMGAEVFDIDLSQEVNDEAFAEITSAFQDHIVLIFRDQNLTDQQQFDFSAR